VGKKLYVGNLPFTCKEEEIRTMFAQYGEVHSVSIITDRETGSTSVGSKVKAETRKGDSTPWR
jgi:RNA recognition motif-containing protein